MLASTCPLKVPISQGLGPYFQIELYEFRPYCQLSLRPSAASQSEGLRIPESRLVSKRPPDIQSSWTLGPASQAELSSRFWLCCEKGAGEVGGGDRQRRERRSDRDGEQTPGSGKGCRDPSGRRRVQAQMNAASGTHDESAPRLARAGDIKPGELRGCCTGAHAEAYVKRTSRGDTHGHNAQTKRQIALKRCC